MALTLIYGRWKWNPLRVVSLISAIGAILVPLWFSPPAVAQSQGGDFSCRAAALRAELAGSVIFEEPVANEPRVPCQIDQDSVFEVPPELVLLTARTAEASTQKTADEGKAFAQVQTAEFLGVVFARVLTARASATCDENGDAQLRSDSEILGLDILGVPDVDTAQAQTIDIPGIPGRPAATVFLNREIRSADGKTVTRRALEIDFLDPALADIVLAEAIADVERCDVVAAGDNNNNNNNNNNNDGGGKPACSDGIDNDGDGQTDFPNDPGCDSAQDNDERNQCVDGIDNDGDGKIDFPNDPGCDSAQDNDESDRRSGLRSAGRVCAAPRNSFVARVQGSRIRSVVFSLSGRTLARDTSAPFTVRVPASRPGTLRARVTYSDGRPGQTLSRRFGRCRGAGPRFTG